MGGVDLSGQTHVITGGDSGMGYETALALASAKARVILACRSHTKCPAAAASITQSTGNKDVVVIPLDLSSFDSVRQCAAAIRKNVSRLDVLIHNAALLGTPKGIPSMTGDGFDITYQVSFLGAHLLNRELLPLLRSSNARVITVASISSFFACMWGNYGPACTNLVKLPTAAKANPAGPSIPQGGMKANNYGMAKYLDVFATAELARREANITAVVLHPGIVDTPMTGDVPKATLEMWCVAEAGLQGQPSRPCPRSAEQGASTQTYLAVAPIDQISKGSYYSSCSVHNSVRDVYSMTHGEKATLNYQSGIYDMADGLVGPSGFISV